jgi:preprotein translocase subunit SecF
LARLASVVGALLLSRKATNTQFNVTNSTKGYQARSVVSKQGSKGFRGYRRRSTRRRRSKGHRRVNIDATTESEEEKKQARLMLAEYENADRANARNREIEVTKALNKRDWMQSFVGIAAMVIGITLVIWAKSGVEDKEIFFHILGFAEGTLVGQVVNYYFGSSQK